MALINTSNLRVDSQGRVRVGGASSGVDTQGTVDSIIRARRLPIDRINTRIRTNQERITALEQMRTLVQRLQSSLVNMRGATMNAASDLFQARQTYLSNFRTDGRAASQPVGLLSVNASRDAPLGQNEIEIRQVARAHKVASKSYRDPATALGISGSMRISGIRNDQGAPQNIEIDAEDSLNDIRNQINAANSGANATGVSANIVQLSTDEHILVLTARATGRKIRIAGDQALIGASATNSLNLVKDESQNGRLNGLSGSTITGAAGIQSVQFDAYQGENGFWLSYNASSKTLVMTRVYDGASQSIDISGELPVAANATKAISFSDFGATVTLNHQFNQGTDITLGNGVTDSDANSGAIDDASIQIINASGDVSEFDFTGFSLDLNANSLDLSNIRIVSGAFSGTFDGTAIGSQDVVMTNANGDTVTVRFDVQGAFNNQGAPSVSFGNHTFTQGGNSGAINAASMRVTGASGDITGLNQAALAFNVADPTAIVVSAGGFTGTFDGTATGSKTLVLNKAGAPPASMTLTFTVDTAFDDQGNPQISLNNNRYSAGGDAFNPDDNSGVINDAGIEIISAAGDVSGFNYNGLSFSFDGVAPNNPASIVTITSGSFSGTFDGTATGSKDVVMADGNGNTVTVRLNVQSVFDTQGAPSIALGNHTYTGTGNRGQITAATIAVTGMTGDVADLNRVDLNFDVSNPAAIVVSGGGFTGTFDGTAAGQKTLVLNKAGPPSASMTLTFTVGRAFNDQGNPGISLNNHAYSTGGNSARIRTDATLRLLNTQGDVSAVNAERMTFSLSDPSRVEARLGNFTGHFDGTETGVKIVTLRDGQGNSLTIQFSLDRPFNNQVSPSLGLGFLKNLLSDRGNNFKKELQIGQNARLAIKGLTDESRYETDIVPEKRTGLKSYLKLAPDSGELRITVNGQSVTVSYDVNDADDNGTADDPLTLEGLAAKINAAITAAGDVTATARIVDYADGSRLVIESNDPNNPDLPVSLSDPNFLLFDLGMDNSQVVERQTNTIDDLFGGLTLNLLNAEEGTTIRLETERDPTQIRTAITAFVQAYNAFKTFANQQSAVNPETGQSSGQPLFGDQTLKQVESITNFILGTGASNQANGLSIKVLAEIGINFVNNSNVTAEQHDTLEVNESKLNNALLNDFEGVRRLFSFDLTSSDSRISFIGLDGVPAYDPDGYTLNLSYAGGVLSAATIQSAGSTDATAYRVAVRGNILRVEEGPAKGLRLFYGGDGTEPASVSLNFTTGFAQQLYSNLQNTLHPTTGTINNAVKALKDRNELSEARKERIDTRVALERSRLVKKFTHMEQNLKRAESVRQSLEQLFNALAPRKK